VSRFNTMQFPLISDLQTHVAGDDPRQPLRGVGDRPDGVSSSVPSLSLYLFLFLLPIALLFLMQNATFNFIASFDKRLFSQLECWSFGSDIICELDLSSCR
jgi:hypothetical protein